jgi:site-specific DNA recombinase
MNQPLNKEKIKYLLYARKSSESEDRQVASIKSQIDVLTEMAKKEGLKILGIISEAKSAKAPGRSEFNEMLARIHKGEAQGIICWKLDRLARNPVDGGSINWMLQEGVIKHIKTHERSYYPTDNVLMMSVEFGMANQFIRDLSQNTKRGLKTKAERGWYPTYATLGYIHNPLKRKGEKEIIKDPERFDLTKKMWGLMLTGNYLPPRIWEIATNKWGLRNRKGGKISKSTIYRIFNDPFYYGEFEYQKNSGNWSQGEHDPMITREDFEKVQMLLGRKEKARLRKHRFAFTGLIRCGECGAMITAENRVRTQKNGNVHYYTYYHCTKRKGLCQQKHIRQEELKKQILAILNKIEIPPEFHDWAMEELQLEAGKEIKDRNKILTTQQKAYNECLKEIDGVISMRAKGELDEETYKTKMDNLREEKVRFQELLKDTDNRVNKWMKKAEAIFAFARDARKEFETGGLEKQKQILSSLGSNLLLKDQKLQILIQKPLLLIGEVAPEARAIKNKVRTSKNSQNKRTLAEFYAQSPTLLRGLDSNQD